MQRFITKAVCVSLLAICLTLPTGCARLKAIAQAPCPYMAQAKIYKDRVMSALVSAQIGYNLVIGYAGIADKLPDGSAVIAKIQVIDAALDTIGKLYYDKVCLSASDVELADYAAAAASCAQEQLGILN